jgi:hypothetical protein
MDCFIKEQRSAGRDDVFIMQLNSVNWLHQIGTAGNEGLAHGGGLAILTRTTMPFRLETPPAPLTHSSIVTDSLFMDIDAKPSLGPTLSTDDKEESM